MATNAAQGPRNQNMLPLSSKRFPYLRKSALIGLLSLPALALAQSSGSLENRLQTLEQEINRLKQENSSLRQELGLDGKAGLGLVRPAGKEPVLSVNGLVQVQGDFGDKGDSRGNANDRFRLRRVRLGAAGRFLEDFDFKVEGEYVGSSVTMADGFLNFRRYTWANVKLGQFKTPFGYEFLAADPKLFTIERTLGSDRLTLNRQVGAQLSGDFFEKQLSYAVGVFNGNGLNTTTNDNGKFLYMGRLSGIPWQGKLFSRPAKWTLGANIYTSTDLSLAMASDFGFAGNAFSGKRRGLGVDSQFNLGRFDFWAEYLETKFTPAGGKPNPEFDARAWYVQASWFLLPKDLQGVLKYDEFDPNNEKAGDVTGSVTLGLNWYLKGDDLKLQFNYVLSDLPSPAPMQKQLQLRAQVIF